MSFVVVAADVIQTAAADVAQIGSALSAGNLAAAIPTTELAAAGADEVSAAVAALFGAHAREYQAAAARDGDVFRAVGAHAGRGGGVVR
ncbi:PE family protein, partial [Mycobacterium interjectum]|nr:PE family protein [Mycobacterium interjectum]